ncbi:helix-turn-helix domain-containing protein [Deinococcus sp.]|uniref:helix-turn-helix domain-containing protein n=1 Tax=Deinococcus sp. TaxID=47478 RepID=UPI00286DF1C6|nr:helix-turn-helix domain-containing protein [Deinococcus sp.]
MSKQQQGQQDVSTKEEAVQHGFLTIPQVQVRLQINRDRVYAMIRAGIIPSVHIGGSIRIPWLAYEA